ncbi:MAG: pyridoxal-dependent decarboxylase [Pseudomonadota bacterium]
MTPEEFRRAGHELIDWIANYRETIASAPVRAQVEPGQVRSSFSPTPPEHPIDFHELMKTLDGAVVPGVTQVQSPMHYGWFPSNASLASVLGDIASSGMGTLGISWESCPALTEVEEVTVDWMRQLVGLSEKWQGTIHDTASTACLTALMAARERAGEFCLQHGGLQGLEKPLVVYTSEEAHSSVEKAALLAGFGRNNLRMVAVDSGTRSMQVEALDAAMEDDVAAGRTPAAIVASVGSTGVTAFDPVAGVVACAKRHGVWVHVDAAMAGTAMMLPECRHLWEGVEDADSVSWNPHKWMGTILDTSLFFVQDPQHLIRVMSTNPSYLQSNVDGEVVQYRDWGIPLGRRFRSLKLWFHLSLDGPDAIRQRLRRDLENARWLAEQVENHPEWEVVSPLTLQTVCVRHTMPGVNDDQLDDHTLNWVRKINDSGAAFMSPSKLNGRWMVRVSIGVESTERHHVESLWALMQQTASQ